MESSRLLHDEMDEFEDYDDNLSDRDVDDINFDNEVEVVQLSPKSQWLVTLFNPSRDIRKVAQEWDIRLFIWKRFWDRLFETEEYSTTQSGQLPVKLNADDEMLPDLLPWEPRRQETAVGNAPPCLHHFKGTMWERHQENIYIANAIGIESYTQALDHQNEKHHLFTKIMALRTICLKELAGVDIYWDGLVEARSTRKDPSGNWYRKQAPNTSKSKFGSLRVWSFPFCAIFRYDDTPEYVVFSVQPLINGIRRLPSEGLTQLEAFVKLNMSEEVQMARELRMKLRSMDGQKVVVKVGDKRRDVECQYFILHREADDMGDLWKNNTTNEIVSVVPGFEFEVRTYASQKTDDKCIAFMCGEPEAAVHPDHFLRHVNAEDPEVEPDDFTEGARALEPTAYGIQFAEYFHPDDPGLLELVTRPGNIDDQFLEYVKKLYQSYRDRQQETHTWKDNTLSYEFWLRIYHDDHITMDELRIAIETYENEKNPLRKDLFGDGVHAEKLVELYQRLETFDKSDVIACWYMFWHAIELHNRARKGALFPEAVQRILDPTEPGSLMAVKHTRVDLERYLMANEVWKPDGSGVITDELIDALYTKLDELQTLAVIQLTKKWQQVGQAGSEGDQGKTSLSARLKSNLANSASTADGITVDDGEEEENYMLREVDDRVVTTTRSDRLGERGRCARLCGSNDACHIM